MSSVATPRTLVDLVAARARTHPSRTAIDDGELRLTYADMWVRIQAAAALLLEEGVRPGDRVLVVARNSCGWVVAAFAALAVGATVAPLGHGVTRADKQRAVDQLRPRLVLADDASWSADDPVVPAVSLPRLVAAQPAVPHLPGVEPAAPAVILATSGTTGAVKYVPMPHGELTSLYGHISGWLGLRETDLLLGAVPLAHSFGFNGVLLVALWAGAGVRLVDRYDAARLPGIVDDSALTVLAGPPTIYHDLQVAGCRFEGVRQAITGSTDVQAARMRAICDELGVPELVVGYGMTETCGSVALGRVGADPGSRVWLAPLDDLEVRVVDPAGAEAAPGADGRLLVRGSNVVTRYADGTPAPVDAAGWLDTGDLAERDEQGRITIVSRVKDTVIVSGFNVVPQEVERVLTDHPRVQRAVVIGVPDVRQGERLVACVIPEGAPPSRASLDTHLRNHLAAFKVPGLYLFVDEFPTTVSGKVSRATLRRQLAEAIG